MKTNKETLTASESAKIMREAGAAAGQSMITHVSVRAAIRRVFGETKPEKETYEALRDAFVAGYIPKALDAHRAPDGTYKDAYIGLTDEARRERAMKAGRSYFGDRVREIYGATQRTPRAGGSQDADEMSPRDAAMMIKAFIDAMVTRKGKDAAEAAADGAALLAMARQVEALPALASRADTVAFMYAEVQIAAEEAEEARAEAAAAEAAREAEIERIVQARIAALTGGGTVGAALATAATGKGRKRKVA